MKPYIIINGTLGAGKSTVGRRVAELLNRSAFIDGDFVIEMFPHVDYYETEAMQRDNILHMSKNYYHFNQCDTVVLSWIMGEKGTEKIVSELFKLDFIVYHFILTCSEEALKDRWHKDAVNDWRTEENLNMAIDLLEKYNKRTDCIFIDTSHLSMDMTAKKIIEKVNARGK